MYTSYKQLVIWAFAGFAMSFGMNLGGMAHASSLSFFDIFGTGHFSATYHPSLLIVFISGLLPAILYWQFYKRGPTPWWETQWHIPTNTVIDRWLIGGSIIFGLGWAVGGFCPGPSVSGLITGHPAYVAFSYGMYFYILARSFIHGEGEHHWGVSVALGLVPLAFYFVGPIYFPLKQVLPFPTWPVKYSIMGGLSIGISSIIFAQFLGRILGISNIWRHILNLRHPPNSRVPHILFFLFFLFGSVVVYWIAPQAFAEPPYADRPRIYAVIGGALVGLGTEWANGCTSGHGICGVSRLGIRSLVAVPTFMASVFAFLPIVNTLI